MSNVQFPNAEKMHGRTRYIEMCFFFKPREGKKTQNNQGVQWNEKTGGGGPLKGAWPI